ncbi:hypothetical protein pipiens_011859 [Culex pipiens pipiens]|uniref:Cuticular protein n=1 Tax=Culex pipiens pipiens TaxID=38569 RepID=A0ABD1D4P2_CULPP
MKALFVLGIVLALNTCSLADESSQNDIQKRNGGEQSLPAFNYPYMRQTTVNHEPRGDTLNDIAHGYQQQQSDWEVQKVQAQALRFQGSPQYQHSSKITTCIDSNNQSTTITSTISNSMPLQQSQHYQHQYQQPPAILYQPVVTQYQKPQLLPAHKVVYPVPVQMRPPPPQPAVAKKVQPPIYVEKHIMYHHVPKPVAVPIQPGKPMPVMQVIIREDGNHKKMPFWG